MSFHHMMTGLATWTNLSRSHPPPPPQPTCNPSLCVRTCIAECTSSERILRSRRWVPSLPSLPAQIKCPKPPSYLGTLCSEEGWYSVPWLGAWLGAEVHSQFSGARVWMEPSSPAGAACNGRARQGHLCQSRAEPDGGGLRAFLWITGIPLRVTRSEWAWEGATQAGCLRRHPEQLQWHHWETGARAHVVTQVLPCPHPKWHGVGGPHRSHPRTWPLKQQYRSLQQPSPFLCPCQLWRSQKQWEQETAERRNDLSSLLMTITKLGIRPEGGKWEKL